MKHSELVERAARWLKGQRHWEWSCPVVVTEYRCIANEQPDVFGLSSSHTVLIECKASLSDFKADQKKHHRNYTHQLGTHRFYFCEKGLIKESDVPQGWGLLWLNSRNVSVICKPEPQSFEKTRIQEYLVLYSLVRRAMTLGYKPGEGG